MTKKSKNFTQSDTHHMGWISYVAVGLLSNEKISNQISEYTASRVEISRKNRTAGPRLLLQRL